MSEEIILSGTEETLKPIITLLLGIYQLIENRDIGDIVGLPLEEHVKAQAPTTSLKIFWMPRKNPPYTPKPGEKLIRPYCNIPDVKKTKIDWQTIKTAAGGSNGYTWGRFRCTANLDNGRQMQVLGGSADDAEDRLKALAELSTAKILTLSVTEEKKEGRRAEYESLYKNSTKVYPAYFSVINSEKILVESNRERKQNAKSQLKSTLANDFKRERTKKIPLWIDKEPSNLKKIIAETLRVRGTNSKP
jgi:hypothetical protein